MSIRRKENNYPALYVMLAITLFLMAGTAWYLSRFTTTEQALRADKDLRLLNGPWKFITGDNMQYAKPGYNDTAWKSMDLAAPAGAHDDDVGLSGFVPGWTEKGYPGYSGYAWYRLTVQLDSSNANNLAFLTPPAVDDAYQLFINGLPAGGIGDFSGSIPVVYSVRPQMALIPTATKQKDITIAFRVWMSKGSLGAGAGGIHIAPTLGEQAAVKKKYSFQWEQTIKGYIVEVVLPLLFVLLAITMFLFSKRQERTRSCKWFATALLLTGLLRLNQAVYFWFPFESGQQATIVGSVITRPLALGAWLMAWREWFGLYQPKWLPKLIALVTSLFIVSQLFSLSWIGGDSHFVFQAITGYLRLLLLAVMLFTLYQAARKKGVAGWPEYLALLLVTIAMYPQEISALHIIPGIWFPYGVGVSRGQFFYAGFILVMYAALIRENKNTQGIAV